MILEFTHHPGSDTDSEEYIATLPHCQIEFVAYFHSVGRGGKHKAIWRVRVDRHTPEGARTVFVSRINYYTPEGAQNACRTSMTLRRQSGRCWTKQHRLGRMTRISGGFTNSSRTAPVGGST